MEKNTQQGTLYCIFLCMYYSGDQIKIVELAGHVAHIGRGQVHVGF